MASQTALESTASGDAMNTRGGGGPLGALKALDIPLMLYFLFWYVGNYYVSIFTTTTK